MENFLTLVILDGFGYSPIRKGNAVALARKPFFDYIFQTYSKGLLIASGEAVGLPKGQMGNSEVGHMNIGAGRIVHQDLVRISKSISDKSFFKNKVIKKAIDTAKKNKSRLHLIGLLSDGGVHSHINHLLALLDFAKKEGFKDVCIHAALDGRDTPPRSAEKYLKVLMKKIKDLGIGRIGTIGGRYYYMDRDKRWDRTEKAYNAMVLGEGKHDPDPISAVEDSYKDGKTDEFVEPVIVSDDCKIRDNDVIFFFNFRSDRVRQIVSALCLDDFNGFKRKLVVKPSYVATMTMYEKDFPFDIAFPPIHLRNVLGEVISDLGFKQFRIAETEKYAHVTYFFNGGREKPFPGEERFIVPSPKVATYDLKPEMSAYQVADETVKRINLKKYKLIVVNFANPDMVGHTGNLNATIKAIETVDKCLERVVKATVENGGTCIVTADHGNAEQMIYPDTGKPCTTHTTNPVPFIVIEKSCGNIRVIRRKKSDVDIPESFGGLKVVGILGDIAPSILYLLNLSIPPEMTGDIIVAK